MKKAKGIAATKAVMPFAMEGAKMLEVYLLKQGAQSTAKLSLPATDYALLDALDKTQQAPQPGQGQQMAGM